MSKKIDIAAMFDRWISGKVPEGEDPYDGLTAERMILICAKNARERAGDRHE